MCLYVYVYNRLQHVQSQEKKKTSCTKLPALDRPKYYTSHCKTYCFMMDCLVINILFCVYQNSRS